MRINGHRASEFSTKEIKGFFETRCYYDGTRLTEAQMKELQKVLELRAKKDEA